MEDNKNIQAENENMPEPKSLKKMNKTMIVLSIIALVCFITPLIFGYHAEISKITPFIGCGLVIIVTVMQSKNRIQK